MKKGSLGSMTMVISLCRQLSSITSSKVGILPSDEELELEKYHLISESNPLTGERFRSLSIINQNPLDIDDIIALISKSMRTARMRRDAAKEL